MIQINIADVNIDIHEGPVGISCSGGADSSLLLYLLMNHSKGPIHIFTCANKLKQYSSITSTVNVIKKCIELTNNNNIFHHIHFVENQTSSNFYLDSHFDLVKILYTGITSNPPKQITDLFRDPTTEQQDRDPTLHRNLYHRNNSIYTPFYRINKKTISQMYTELSLLDTIFPLTRSCENLNFTELHCGKCWWCEERLWAFGALDN